MTTGQPIRDVLELAQLSKHFGKVIALESLDLVVPAGSLTVILGPAGAGKTTTLRLVAGLEVPTAGSIRIAGRNVARIPPNRRDVAMIFDNLALYPNRTGFDNIASPLMIAGMNNPEIAKTVKRIAKLLQVEHVLDRLPRTMSGGERQRVAFGRAFVRQAALFLLDEPLSNLDAMLRLELRAELKRLQRESGYSFLLATPEFTEALALADEVVFLRAGRVHQVAPPQVLYDRPADIETARFVGAPEINICSAQFDPSECGRISCAGMTFPAPETFSKELGTAAVRFRAGIRPESIAIGPPDAGRANARTIDVESHGLKSTIVVDVSGSRLRVSLPADAPVVPKINEIVAIDIVPERILAFDYEAGFRLF
jgi:multiple sugar transport system ATP-binding protein